jgi:hypothetical protein
VTANVELLDATQYFTAGRNYRWQVGSVSASGKTTVWGQQQTFTWSPVSSIGSGLA